MGEDTEEKTDSNTSNNPDEGDEEAALSYEVEIVWTRDVSELDYVAEGFVYADTSQDEIQWERNEDIVGYGVISTHAPYAEDFPRRVFYVPENPDTRTVDPREVQAGEKAD